ncbi:MAG: acyl carrier protein [Lachnospiraceae bacterium]|nr:acyl carrier protein [Lachnospiraceae bacterium]
MFEEIGKILKEEYGIVDISRDMDVKGGLGLNSFDLMNLICIVEERYHIEIDEEQYRQLVTLGEMCDYVELKIREQRGKAG